MCPASPACSFMAKAHALRVLAERLEAGEDPQGFFAVEFVAA